MNRFSRFLAATSSAFNVVLFNGLEHDMISARAHREDWKLRKWLNRAFFWQTDHCLECHLHQAYRPRLDKPLTQDLAWEIRDGAGILRAVVLAKSSAAAWDSFVLDNADENSDMYVGWRVTRRY